MDEREIVGPGVQRIADQLPGQVAVLPQFLKFERTEVAAFLRSNSNSVPKIVQARRTDKVGLNSRSSD